MDGIDIEDRGAVRLVTFRRPEVMNAWDRPMRRAIAEAIREADRDGAVGALVFTGEGTRAFGAGQDLREAALDETSIDPWVDEWEDLFAALRGCSKPTVCAINGVAAGSHFQFALLADARIGHSGIRMGQPEIKSGVASAMGPWIIQTVMGPLAAQDLALSGRLMGAEECERRGLVSRLVPADELLPAAIQHAESLAAHPPLAMRLTKERLREMTEASFREVFPVWKRYLRETTAGEGRRDEDIPMTDWPTEKGTFALGDLRLQSGAVLPGAMLSWKTHGTLAPDRSNVVLYPTSYSAHHADLEWLIGPDGVLDPTRWFVVIPDMFGNGLSTSPSNNEDWPDLVTAWDNVHAQSRLLAERWGIERLHAVYGWSMGAQQAYHWAALFPDRVARAIVNCGSARTAVHNRVFLKGLMAVLEAAPEHLGRGRFETEPAAALRAFGRIYAGWGLSQDFYRAGLHLSALGAPDLDTFLRTNWEERFAKRRAADLYAQLVTWEAGDIARDAAYGGDLAKALAAIEARVLLMPGATDLYFRVADNEAELPHLKHGTLTPIPSIWGHRAGNPSADATDTAFLKETVRAFLE